MSERRVYLRPWEDRKPESELMRFRLCYEGELKATKTRPNCGAKRQIGGAQPYNVSLFNLAFRVGNPCPGTDGGTRH